ncbi:AMP-binding protein [Haloferula sargassicola]|uniref:2-succinylbenzoate--CoA ligase n=1 Tax=Haloferula sargassicola TaxID=490096 RepID=A0ABP9UML0_9BACT
MEEALLMDPAFWAATTAHAPGAEFPEVEGDLPGLVYFQTSGSTGEPKWIGLTREALLLSAAVVNRHLGVTGDDTWGLLLPLHHVGGFGVVARAFEAGCRLSRLPGRWDPVTALDWLTREKISHCPMVPAQVHDLVAAGLRAPAELRTIVVGGGSMSDELGRSARGLGWPVLASYGMTEAGSQIATQSLEQRQLPFHAAPIPLLPHWQACGGPDDRLEIEGAALFSGMLTPSAGRLRYQPRAPGRFATTDRVQLDGREITVLGRSDRRVKVLGELVDLDSIESRFESSILVALPDPRRGSRLVLVTSLAASGEQVAAFNREVAGPWRIDAVLHCDELPRTPLGKPDRRAAGRLASARSAC